MKKQVWHILNKLHIASIVQLVLKSGLKEDGWFKSYHTKQAVDKKGNPIPWCTYPFIKFIEPRLNNNLKIFEFGCGNSTLWYASKVKTITSVEHDREWYELVKKSLPENAKIIYKELKYGGAYSKSIFENSDKFNIVIVDGRDRVNCAENAVEALTSDGVIVFDNTERPQYSPALEYLHNKGFKQLDFHGLSPVTAHNNLTSIFYRKDNCLNF